MPFFLAASCATKLPENPASGVIEMHYVTAENEELNSIVNFKLQDKDNFELYFTDLSGYPIGNLTVSGSNISENNMKSFFKDISLVNYFPYIFTEKQISSKGVSVQKEEFVEKEYSRLPARVLINYGGGSINMKIHYAD